MAVVEVTSEPSGLYLRAALGLLPSRRPSTLPDISLVRRKVKIDRDQLARYDRVCGFRLTDVLPPTYPHLLAFPLAMRLMSAADFPFPVVGVVHVANRITIFRDIDAGEALDVTVRCANLRPHHRGQQFDVIASVTSDDETVWHGVSTYLSRGGRRTDGASGAEPATGSAGPDARQVARGADMADSGDISDMSGGDPAVTGPTSPSGAGLDAAAPTARWRVPGNIGNRYAAVSGDRNPIHTSRIGARLFGFPRPIAHGMWTKARCLAALEGRLPEQYTVDVTFRRPVLLPSTVGFAAAATGDGWEFRVDGRKPHLAGVVTPP
jgi:MaoC like domain